MKKKKLILFFVVLIIANVFLATATTTTITRGKKFDLAFVLREARTDGTEIDPPDIGHPPTRVQRTAIFCNY